MSPCRRVGEQQLLCRHRSGRIDVHRDAARVPARQSLGRVRINMPDHAAIGVAFGPDHPLNGLQRGNFAVLVMPREQLRDRAGKVKRRRIGFPPYLLQFGRELICMLGDEAGQPRARVGKQHVVDECEAGRRPFDIGDDRANRHAAPAYSGTPRAIVSPVNRATQPSGSANRRIAVKRGAGPMSNQCRVPSGTAIRSSRVHSSA